MASDSSLPGKPRILIIGVGNADRGDDAMGLLVARRLQETIGNSATIREMGGEGAALIDAWSEAQTVILIDAVQGGAEPGSVYRFDARTHPIPAMFSRSSTHTFGIAEAIGLARALHCLPSQLIVYGIEGKNFALGARLSPTVERAAEDIVQRVQQEVLAWSAAAGG